MTTPVHSKEGATPHGGPSRLDPTRCERDRHLARDGRKRILSLDGGGVRGILSLGLLQAVEDILRRRSDDPASFRLCDYFDLIGGTSTGSIIATMLARGRSVSEIQEMYLELAPGVFGRAQSYGFNRPKFDAKRLEEFIYSQLGGIRLGDSGFRTGFALFTKRLDTGAPWLLSNHPDSLYWETHGGKDLPNKDYPVAGLVRASTAAPYYFEAADVTISKGGEFKSDEGIFLDGAVGGANNPSLHLFVLATLADYPFRWTPNSDDLLVVSIGTGRRRLRISRKQFRRLSIVGGLGSNAKRAVVALQAMIQDTELQALTVMQALSIPPDGDDANRWPINSELDVMRHAPIGGREHALCTFRRIDASLEDSDVEPLLLNVIDNRSRRLKAIKEMSLMDCGEPANLERLLRVGRQWGSKLKASDFPTRFDVRKLINLE